MKKGTGLVHRCEIKAITCVVASLMAVSLFAETEMVNGITWTYRIFNGEAELFNNYDPVIPEATIGSITVPSSLGGCPVTGIGVGAFRGCGGLTGVVIPNSVTSIGESAFCGCSGLTNVTLPDSIISIGWFSFADCGGLTGVTIGNGVTSIGEFAFSGCGKLVNVTIPNNVTSIERFVFSWCTNLTSVSIGRGMTNIGEGAFDHCSKLNSFSVADGNPFFMVDSGLLFSKDDKTLVRGINGSVTIPSGVTTISDYAFEGCSGLTRAMIPDSVTSIGKSAFNGCFGLTGTLTIPSSVTNIGSYAFCGCSGLTGALTIPSGVTHVGSQAFFNCSGLAGALVIHDGVTSIGESAFGYCKGLTSVTIPDSVTSIWKYAFDGCSSLRKVMMLGDAPSVGVTSFYGCHANCTVHVRRDSTGWGVDIPGTWNGVNIVYWDDDEPSPITSYTVTYTPGSYGTGVQQIATKTNDVELALNGAIFTRTGYTQAGWATSDGGSKAYDLGASYIVNAMITLYPFWMPNSYQVTFDANGGSCSQSSILVTYDQVYGTLPTPSMTGYSFDGWYTSVNGGTKILSTTMVAITSLQTLYAHWVQGHTYCTVTFDPNGGSVSPATRSVESGAAIGELPTPTREGYTFAGWWTAVDGGIQISESTRVVGDVTYYAHWALTDFIIVDNVLIGVTRRDMAEAVIPYGVTSIGEEAFEGCDELTSVIIPNSVSNIGNYAFSNCRSLTSVTIPDSVTNIGSLAFAECENLEDVRIPSSIASVGENVFGNYDAPVVPFLRKLEAAKTVVAARMLSGELQSQKTDARYDLSSAQKDRAIAAVTVNGDTELDNFVLTDGKVYDSVLYINNVANRTITLSLPSGNIYKAFKGATPLVVPAQSQCILTITRIAESVFLVSREDLETIQ